jgi:hypothetical protein
MTGSLNGTIQFVVYVATTVSKGINLEEIRGTAIKVGEIM